MSREIKFRAWDEITKSMVSWGELTSFKNNLKLSSLKGVTSLKWEQFTGLKDKKDVDIYNGDKLLFNGYISTVVYNVGNARFEAHGEKHTVPAHKFKLCEIVGKIHENKD